MNFLIRMYRLSHCLCFIASTLASTLLATASPTDNSSFMLWYDRPAVEWIEALPVGNGRLGAMVFGGIQQERLQLNEDTLWAGSPYEPTNPEAIEALPEIRRLLAEGRHAEAQALVDARFMAQPRTQMPYQTMADLLITMSGSEYATDYRRALDLSTALATTEFTVGTVQHRREVFASAADDVIVVRLQTRQAEDPGSPAPMRVTLAFQSPQHSSISTEGSDTLILNGRNSDHAGISGGLTFEVRAQIHVEDGSVRADSHQIHIEGASTATIVISAATSFRRFDAVDGDPSARNLETLSKIQKKAYPELVSAHHADYRDLFDRVSIDLGRNHEAEMRPTNERVRHSATREDPSLAALYFQYGRYLLISSSRPGTQPANLQGIWNDHLHPPWESKYTLNINAQMNYWPAEVTNLAELSQPLFSMIQDLSETGARYARKHYGAKGWVTHHNTDLWRATGPIDGAFWGMWPTGGAWLSLHLWEHFRYNPNLTFLAEAYPLLRGSAAFFLDTLQEHPEHGWLVTSPSNSPENAHHPDVTLAMGPAMDNQILRDLFAACISAAQLLQTDAAFVAKLRQARDRLPPDQIGAQGQLQEWLEDWDANAPEPEHRHVSHLYALHPGNQITPRGTPALAGAARTSLEARGDISTGWAIAWRLNLWARLHEGDRAHRILLALLSPERTYPNLFCAHPPFQIDGNFGGTAGIAEMLLQSHVTLPADDSGSGMVGIPEIELLPALPSAWPEGFVRGLRARGGFEVDIEWRDGQLTQAVIRAARGGHAQLRYGAHTHALSLDPEETFIWSAPQ